MSISTTELERFTGCCSNWQPAIFSFVCHMIAKMTISRETGADRYLHSAARCQSYRQGNVCLLHGFTAFVLCFPFLYVSARNHRSLSISTFLIWLNPFIDIILKFLQTRNSLHIFAAPKTLSLLSSQIRCLGY